MDDLSKKIGDWLERQGYPFEMYVAQQFQKLGFSVNQSVYYKDEESGKFREIDVIAYTYREINGVWFNITLIIECKASRDKPWIIFKGKNMYKSYDFIYERYMTYNWRMLFDNLRDSDDESAQKAIRMFDIKDNPIGYSITQAFTEGQDVTFAALNGVTKSSIYFMKKTNESRRKMCNIYIPIIAIDSMLFSTFLDETGQILVEESDIAKMAWRRSYDNHSVVLVEIITKNAIPNQAIVIKDFCDTFFSLAKSAMENVSIRKPYNASDVI